MLTGGTTAGRTRLAENRARQQPIARSRAARYGIDPHPILTFGANAWRRFW
jgi:hypothetical protein